MTFFRSRSFIVPFAILASLASTIVRADLPPDILAKNRWVELKRADYDAAIERIPPAMRYDFATSAKRVQLMLNGLLLDKTLAAQAQMHGTQVADADKGATGRDLEKALAKAELARIEADANASFDAQKSVFEAKALEVYKVNADKYRTPDEVRISDISVLLRGRTEDAARARALEARNKIVAGADFADVAREYSEDKTTRDKGGALPFVAARQLLPAYAKAVFALKQVGEISQPIRAIAAYHIVRLDERRPGRVKTFEEARDEIMKTLRQKYVVEQRERYVQSIYKDPSTQVNQAAVDGLVNKVDPKLFRQGQRPFSPAAK